jgi:hypothetical protein
MYSIKKRLNSKHWQDKISVLFFVVSVCLLVGVFLSPYLYFKVYDLDEVYGTTFFLLVFCSTFLFVMRNIHILSDFRSEKNVHVGELEYSINTINPAKTTLTGDFFTECYYRFDSILPMLMISVMIVSILTTILVGIQVFSVGTLILFVAYNLFLNLINSILFRIVNSVIVKEEEIFLLGKANDITDEESEKIKKKMKKVIKNNGYVTRLNIIALYNYIFNNDEFKNRKKKANNMAKYSNYLKK